MFPHSCGINVPDCARWIVSDPRSMPKWQRARRLVPAHCVFLPAGCYRRSSLEETEENQSQQPVSGDVTLYRARCQACGLVTRKSRGKYLYHSSARVMDGAASEAVLPTLGYGIAIRFPAAATNSLLCCEHDGQLDSGVGSSAHTDHVHVVLAIRGGTETRPFCLRVVLIALLPTSCTPCSRQPISRLWKIRRRVLWQFTLRSCEWKDSISEWCTEIPSAASILLWLRHGGSKRTKENGNVHRRKTSPDDWWWQLTED
jgi:hypothetical protein